MKKFLQSMTLGLLLTVVIMSSCRRENLDCPGLAPIMATERLQSRYTPIAEFRQGISEAAGLIAENQVIAYLDTMPNGFPNVNGRKEPLANFCSMIYNKLQGNAEQVASAVYDIFHFDGATFSLISYIRKAQMAGNITAETMVKIISKIPVPPIPVPGFQAPLEIVKPPVMTGDCCKDNISNPKISILVTWVHVAPCGNYAKGKSGYAANNKFTGMPGGQSYRFTAEISGSPCPGTLTHTVTTPPGASYGEATGKDGSVDILPVTPGTYTITFTYTTCGITVTKTFSLGVG